MDTRPIATLKNLGPVTARDLAEVGIETTEQLREVGAVAAYARLRSLKPKHYTLVGLYALAGALEDVNWMELPEETKVKLRAEAGMRGRSTPKPRREPAVGSRR